MPYRLVPGPLLTLPESSGGSGGGVPEERRRFLVLYEIVAAEGSDRPPAASRGALVPKIGMVLYQFAVS